MTQHNSHYGKQTARRDMNRALDHLLPGTAQEALEAHLAVSGQDALLWANLQAVDRLLSSEPMLEAPPDFAACVMAAVAGEKQPDSAHQWADLRAVISLVLVVLALLPLVLTALMVVQHWISDPAVLSVLFHQITLMINNIAQAITPIFQVIAQNAAGKLVAVGALSSVLSILLVAKSLQHYLAPPRELVIYRIPVVAG